MASEAQLIAVRAQMAAHKAFRGGDHVAEAQALDEVAQFALCLRDGAFLPNATGEGLTILPGTERLPLDPETVKDYVEKVKASTFTPFELGEAMARLDANLAAGVTLDPKTAESVDPADYA